MIGSNFGEYDECISIESTIEPEKPTIRGQYCFVKPSLPLPKSNSYRSGEPIDNYLEEMIKKLINSSEKLKSRIPKEYDINNYTLTEESIEKVLSIGDIIANMSFPGYPIGICIPTTCKPQDIENAINKCKY